MFNSAGALLQNMVGTHGEVWPGFFFFLFFILFVFVLFFVFLFFFLISFILGAKEDWIILESL